MVLTCFLAKKAKYIYKIIIRDISFLHKEVKDSFIKKLRFNLSKRSKT